MKSPNITQMFFVSTATETILFYALKVLNGQKSRNTIFQVIDNISLLFTAQGGFNVESLLRKKISNSSEEGTGAVNENEESSRVG